MTHTLSLCSRHTVCSAVSCGHNEPHFEREGCTMDAPECEGAHCKPLAIKISVVQRNTPYHRKGGKKK